MGKTPLIWETKGLPDCQSGSAPAAAPQFFCRSQGSTIADWKCKECGGTAMRGCWEGKDKGDFYSNPSYFSSGRHLTVIFAIYINVCDIPVRAGDTRAWLKQKEARVQIQAEQKNFNIVVTAECEVEQSWSGWCRCSTIGLVGQSCKYWLMTPWLVLSSLK